MKSISSRQTSAQAEWAETLAAAKQEGKLVLSAPRGLEEFGRVLKEPFEKEFGIAVDSFRLGAKAVLEHVRKERSAGRYLWDVFVGGTDSLFLNMKPMGVMEPIEAALILPEVKKPVSWKGAKLPFFDHDRLGLYFLYGAGQHAWINTFLAGPEEFKSYRDLLNPKWKGKILFTKDPRLPGHGRSVLLYFYIHKNLGPEFILKLLRQDLLLPKDSDVANRYLKEGKFALCFTNNAGATRMAKEGLPVKLLNPHWVKEGMGVTSSYANVAFANRAPHPNAAKIFINWLLSRTTGTTLSSVTGLVSPRVDVSDAFAKPSVIPKPEWPVTNHEDMARKAEAVVKLVEGSLGKMRSSL